MKIFKEIAEELKSNGLLDEEKEEIFTYGLEIMTSTSLQILSILLISILLGNFLPTILYFITFIPLRIFAGGYHSRTRTRCYLLSLFVYGMFSILCTILPQNYYTQFALVATFLSLIMVFISAPVIGIKRNISHGETIKYKKISRMIVFTETLLIVTVAFFICRYAAVCLACGQGFASLSMAVADIIDKYSERRFHNEEA